jgi:rhodanese-related sulfurtransferase
VIDINSEFLKANRDSYILIDIREPHELVGNMALIEGAHPVPMGNPLLKFLESADPSLSYVFICSAGVRSRVACEIAESFGFHKVYNLKGGMVEWNT